MHSHWGSFPPTLRTRSISGNRSIRSSGKNASAATPLLTRTAAAGLRLDTVEWIQKGYLDDDDNPKQAVVAGNPAKSPLYTSTALPADHDDIMPPKGDPLSKAEQSLLKNWITQGANFGDFKAPAYKNPKAK